jgi:pyruvate/2-oxoglutarate dehydrogenase complex dihydrolipoamide acyltransferase (E2) component
VARRPLTAASGAGYVVDRIPRGRRPVLDRLAGARRRFQVHALVELDVSEARELISAAEPRVSWTGFLIASLGRAVARHPEVNARMAGNRILTFDRVDIGATVERQWQGRTALDIAIIRDADRMSPADVSALLQAVKRGPGESRRPSGPMRAVLALPGPLRRIAIRVAGTRPRMAASFGPAVGITSIGMFTSSWGWAIPLAPLTVIATVGGVVERPVVRDGRVVARPMLPLTVSFDHAVIDGAPATRFTETLRELVETAAVMQDAAGRR